MVEETKLSISDERESDEESTNEQMGLANELSDMNYLADAMLRLGGREYTSLPDDEQLKKLMDIRLFILL